MQVLSLFITVALSAVGTFVVASVRDLRAPAAFRTSLFAWGDQVPAAEPGFQSHTTRPAIDASIAIAKARAASVSQHMAVS